MAKQYLTVKKTDIYQNITDIIVAAIRNGVGATVRMPWHSKNDNQPLLHPININSGNYYKGINVLTLWCQTRIKGYESNIWGTFKQWKDQGYSVRKGEKGTPIVYWNVIEDEAKRKLGEDPERMILAHSAVFNAYQIADYVIDKPIEIKPTKERIERCEVFFNKVGARFVTDGKKAFYDWNKDQITMPPIDLYRDSIAYYAVRGHETIHWTGHASRCGRNGPTDDEEYATEELIAELGSAFLCSDLQLASEPREDHAKYLAHWLNTLNNDKRALFTASSKAQRATTYLHSLVA